MHVVWIFHFQPCWSQNHNFCLQCKTLCSLQIYTNVKLIGCPKPKINGTRCKPSDSLTKGGNNSQKGRICIYACIEINVAKRHKCIYFALKTFKAIIQKANFCI